MMSAEQIKTTFSRAMDEIIERCSVSEGYVDKEQFQIMLATIWGNAVLDPSDLESAKINCLSYTTF